MKKIKFIIMAMITFMAFFMIENIVKAETYSGKIWEAEWISGVYINRVEPNGKVHYQTGRFIRRSEDNRFVYCLQPFVKVQSDQIYNVSYSDYAAILNMDETAWQRVSLLAFYGYGYGNHTNNKWYSITQVLIWRTVEPNGKFYFTDSLNGKRNDDIYASEIAELENLVASHDIKPEFDVPTTPMNIGSELLLTDKNNILNNYTITSSENISAFNQNGKLKIVANGVGDGNVILTKTSNLYSTDPILYFATSSQNVLSAGNYDPISKVINFQVVGGKIELVKKDFDNNSTVPRGEGTLKGAVYGIYKNDGTKITELTTDENGYAISGYLPSLGEYYVQEIKPSNGYNLDATKYPVTLTANQLTVRVNVKEKVVEGRLKLIKYDKENNTCSPQGEARLKGAVYQVIDSKGSIVDTLTIGDNCTATSNYLPFGSYTVKEQIAPLGYILDTNVYSATIDSQDKVVTIVSKDQVMTGRIKITKQDSENNSCSPQGQARLEGAIYQIIDLKGKVVDRLTIGADCSATSNYLPYGKYKIKELSAPLGYELDTKIYEVNINANLISLNITSKEDVIKNYISILKQYDYVDETTQFLNAEAGITFEIYYPDGKKYGEITTDKNGYATLEMPYGVWKFHQVNSNTGFEKINDFYITVDENSAKEHYYNILNNKMSAYLQVIKIDSETGKTIEIANTTFKILNTDTNQYVSQYVAGKIYDTFVTDEHGVMVTYLKLEAGNYKLIEVSSPYGYLLNKNGLEFSIGDEDHFSYTNYGAFITVKFPDIPIKGKVEVNKSGEKLVIDDKSFVYEEQYLKNVVFNIYADEDIKTADGQHLYYRKDELVDTIITDESGYAISGEIPLGKYYIVEVKTDDKYILDTTEFHFELREIDNSTNIVYKTYNLTNILKKGKLEFTKTDFVNDEVIPNTKIKIFTDKDEIIFEGATNEKGQIIIDELPVGKYYILEEEPATGYVLNEEKVTFEIKENGEIIKATMTNKPITGKLEVTKTDLTNGEVIPNVVFEIYDELENLVFKGLTNEEGKIVIENLRYGKYKIVEKEPVTGYVLSEEDVYFEILEDGKIVKANITNKPITGKLEFTKTDLVDGTPIPNVEINIYKLGDSEELVFSGFTNEEGKIVIDELLYGKYKIVEITPDPNYILSEEDVYFEILEDGSIVKATMTNKPITGKLEFTKTDLVDGTPIPNVSFDIYKVTDDKEELVFSGFTNEEGKIIVDSLRKGKYFIVENNPADGYILNEEKLYFEINYDGELVEASMTNEKIIIPVPDTGINDSYVVEIIGSVFIISGIGAIILYEIKKRKK